jgi:5'-nucleotidase
MTQPLILLTNDDGIESPGLAAAAAALDPLGELLIIAPASQQTSMARSRSQKDGRDGRLFRQDVLYGDQRWDGIAANATPALSVEHGLQEFAQRPVNLVVSGINYGENIGSCITVSGTIGAALEAADRGIPALAVSIEIFGDDHYHYDTGLDFNAAIHFTRYFAGRMLAQAMPPDVDVIKLDIPAQATPETGWMVTRQDKIAYYTPELPHRTNPFEGQAPIIKHHPAKGKYTATGTDAYALTKGLVSITPLSLDLTSRVELEKLKTLFD